MELCDFDACSLHPSSYGRSELGISQENLKILKKYKLNYEFLKQQDFYLIKIRIRKVGICRMFPFIPYRIKDGTNCTDEEGRVGLYDKFAVEDFIKFQKSNFTC